MKVPTVDLPTVESKPLGTPFQQFDTRGAFGGGEGMRALAKGAGDWGEELQRREAKLNAEEKKKAEDADIAAIAAAEAAYDQHVNQTLYDPEKGFLTTKGGNSLGVRPSTLEGLQKKRKEIEDSLANDNQKNVFRRRSTSTYIGAERTVDNHSAHQSDLLKDLAFKAVEQETLDSIRLGDEENFAIKSENLKQWALVEAKRQGITDGNVAAEMVKGAQAKAVAARLDGLLAPRKNPETGESMIDAAGAREFFAKHGAVLGTRADEYQKKIEAEGTKQDAATTASQIYTRSKQGSGGRWANAQEALDTLELEVPDSNPAKALIREQLEHKLAKDEQLQTQSARKHAANANAAYEKGGMAAVAYEDQKYLTDPANGKTAVDYWQDLKDRARRDSDRWRERQKKDAKPALDTPEQKDAKLDLLIDITDNPSKYMDVDGATLRTLAVKRGLGDKGLEEVSDKLVEIHKAAAGGDPAASLSTDADRAIIVAMRSSMPSLNSKSSGYDPNKPNTYAKKTTPLGNNAGEVFAEVQEKLKDLRAENRSGGKKTTAEEYRKAAEDALAQVRVEKPWLFGLATKTVKTSKADAEKAGLKWEPIDPEAPSAKAGAATDMSDSIALDEQRDKASKTPKNNAALAPLVPTAQGNFDDVPEQDRIQIVEAMQAANKARRAAKKPELPITPAAILNYYNLARGR